MWWREEWWWCCELDNAGVMVAVFDSWSVGKRYWDVHVLQEPRARVTAI